MMSQQKKTNLLAVSIIIPCRNEEKFLAKCLDSIIANDYPKDKLEILVVDGISEDRTREILEEYAKKFHFIKALENPKKFTPFGLNLGIKQAKGEIVIRMDGHATYEKDYISKCVNYLNKYKVDNVGGVMETIPAEKNIISKSIAFSLSHPFGTGGSYFRTGSKNPRWVDTVFGGCYRKEIFKKIGFFNENLKRSQDIEFNLRLKRAGGKILLAPDIVSYYYPKSKLGDFFQHNFTDGIWSIYLFKFVKMPLCLRHYIPFIFVSSLLGTGFLGIFFPFFSWLFLFITGTYLLLCLYFSAKIAYNRKDWKYFFLMPITFLTRHISYGLGSLFGLIKLLFPPKNNKNA